ncbi:MAG: hypothetical protein JWM79_407 [Nocardioides sp.]|nr:hypothetical protein [Nocardioides sp.]
MTANEIPWGGDGRRWSHRTRKWITSAGLKRVT